jgi:peptide/nickel transport system ATP-binding protein
MGTDRLLKVEHVWVDIGHEPDDVVHALQGVSFSVRPEGLTGLVGESGSGKSMTALSILRLLPEGGRVKRGRILFDGQDLQQRSESEMRQVRGKDISMIFQSARAALNPLFTVGQQIASVYHLHARASDREAWEKAVDMLDAMGIPDAAQKAKDYPHQYSGGMAQRAMVAMALVCAPQLLIADEPTTGLDVTIQAQVLDLIVGVVEDLKASLLLISHDIAVIAEVCTDVVVMYAGQVMEAGPVERVLGAPANPYTQALMACFQTYGDGSHRMDFIPGRVPNLRFIHTGCPFAGRCSLAEQLCSEELPALRQIEPGHWVACHFA